MFTDPLLLRGGMGANVIKGFSQNYIKFQALNRKHMFGDLYCQFTQIFFG